MWLTSQTNFWLLADAQSKYLCNGKPYLGRDPSRTRCINLPGDVCLTFLQPYYKKATMLSPTTTLPA